MPWRKPTLTTMVVRQHAWAAGVMLGVMLLLTLVVTDLVIMRVRRNTLYTRIHSLGSVHDALLLLGGLAPTDNDPQEGTMLVDPDGTWSFSRMRPRQVRLKHQDAHAPRRWAEAARIRDAGAVHSIGRLPWVSEPVIWAGRMMDGSDGLPVILVAWENTSAVRGARIPIYITVAAVTLLAFGVSAVLALQTVKDVRLVLDHVAESSSRMAAGDFAVHLPSQYTQELDRICLATNRLANDLARANMDLQMERQRLARLEGVQRQFVADASHELRAPLTSMRVTLEAWQDGVLHADEQADALAQLLRETERLGTLVTNLLDLSRIDSGRETVIPSPLAVDEIATDVIDTFSLSGGARIELAVPADLPYVLAADHALYRILRNLTENARRFTPAEGTIRIWAQPNGQMVRIGVSDTGSGISPDDLPRIWDRFARGSEARAEGKVGSGLGLAIVRALAESMGGTAGAESTVGIGTTVWVELPVATPPADAVPHTVESAAATPSSTRV